MTDANVVLGYIPTGPARQRATSSRLARARGGGRRLGRRLGLSPLEAARGIHDLANATMMRALRAVSTEKGRDPSEFALVAYGGSGPGARGGARGRARCARRRSCRRSRASSPRSACCSRRAEYHDVRFCRVDAREPDLDALRRLDAEMRAHLATRIDGRARMAAHRRRPLPRPELERPGRPAGRDRRGSRRGRSSTRFEAEHERLYGTRLEPGSPIDIRALRLVALGPAGRERVRAAGRRAASAGTRRADFGDGPRRARRACRLAGIDLRRAAPKDRFSSTSTTRRSSCRRAGSLCLDRDSGALVLDLSRDRRRTSARRRRSRCASSANALATARRRDGDDDLPHRALGGRPRRDGLLGGALRPDGRDGRAGRDDPAPARLDPERDADAARRHRRQASRRATSTSSTTRSTARATRPTSSSSSRPSPATTLSASPSPSRTTATSAAACPARSRATRPRSSRRACGSRGCSSTTAASRSRRCSRSSARTSASRTSCSATSPRRSRRARSATAGCRSSRSGTARGLHELIDGLLDHTEPLLRAEIAPLARRDRGRSSTTSTRTGSTCCDVTITVDLTVRGDELVADFSESAPMVRGALNCTPSFVEAARLPLA